MKGKKSLTLTVIANMTANYSEGLGNIASVQKVFKNRKVYTIRSRESLKKNKLNKSWLLPNIHMMKERNMMIMWLH